MSSNYQFEKPSSTCTAGQGWCPIHGSDCPVKYTTTISWGINADGWCPQAGMWKNQPLCALAPKMLSVLKYALDNPEFCSLEFDKMVREVVAEAERGER